MQIPRHKLIQYTYPDENEIKKVGSIGFLGQYIQWDGKAMLKLQKKKGFKVYEKDVKGSIVNYENLDNVYMRIHDYFKFLKYGYDRVTDWCCTHIRRGRMTREEAVKINQLKSGKFLKYLGYKLSEVLDEINCSRRIYKYL